MQIEAIEMTQLGKKLPAGLRDYSLTRKGIERLLDQSELMILQERLPVPRGYETPCRVCASVLLSCFACLPMQ
jgi:hypothetical protein